jgi:pantothenate synthetase
VLYRALRQVQRRISEGVRTPQTLKQEALSTLATEPLVRVEYLEIVNPADMQPVATIEPNGAPVRALAAVWIGSTRLIDNILCSPKGTEISRLFS